MTSYGDDLGKHWISQCLVAWRHHPISWAIVNLSSNLFRGIHSRAISRDLLMNLTRNMCSEITFLELTPHLPGANYLISRTKTISIMILYELDFFNYFQIVSAIAIITCYCNAFLFYWPLLFLFMSAYTKCWTNNRDSGDFKRHDTHVTSHRCFCGVICWRHIKQTSQICAVANEKCNEQRRKLVTHLPHQSTWGRGYQDKSPRSVIFRNFQHYQNTC